MSDIEVGRMYCLNLDKKGEIVTVTVRSVSFANDLVKFTFGYRELVCSINYFKEQINFGKVIIIDFQTRKRVA